MITIHHLNRSRSERIVWLAEELGLRYTLVRHQRDAVTLRAPETLWAINPLGKSPVIEDDGVIVAESGAIVEYVLEKYGNGRLRPAPDDRSVADTSRAKGASGLAGGGPSGYRWEWPGASMAHERAAAARRSPPRASGPRPGLRAREARQASTSSSL